MAKPSTLLFDAGNTLVWLDHPFLVELLGEHGVRTTPRALLEAEHGAKLHLDRLVREGRGGDDRARAGAFFARVFEGVGVPPEHLPALADRLRSRHRERNLWCRVAEGTPATLAALREAGHRLGVVSNADGRVEALLESLGLRAYFDVVVDSGTVGVEKPDPRIFALALERMGAAPEDAVYVGDIYEIDVIGARAAGMRALLLDPLGRFGDLDCETLSSLDELPARLARPA
jgi:putative hydrolase of the HAD superfamily